MTHFAASVLSLQDVVPSESRTARVSLELPRGRVVLLQVDDPADAASLIDLCVGLTDSPTGSARFLGVDWGTLPPRERLRRRRRIGAVVQTSVWPSNMTVDESILAARPDLLDRSRTSLLAEATNLARLFGLPGLPIGQHRALPTRALVCAACVRGFLGPRDLVVVQDSTLEQSADFALPMAQAIAAACSRGGAVLWLMTSLDAQAARFVEADAFRLDEYGLTQTRSAP